MGPFREQLIRVLACLVAIDVAAGIVAIDARHDKSSTVTTGGRVTNAAPPSAKSPGAAAGPQSGGILAAGSFSKRRRSFGQPAAQPTEATTGITAPAVGAPPSTAASSSGRPAAVPTGGSSPSKTRGSTAPAAGQPAAPALSGPATGSTAEPTSAAPGQAAPAQEGEPSAGDPPANIPTPTSGPAKNTTPSSTSGVWTVLDDATGDTVLDATQAPQANARADIVQSRGANTTKGVGLAVKVAQPVDPTKDPTWASDATFVAWEVDTTGDGKPDFEVEYFVDGGKLVAGVNKVTSSGNQAVCQAEAGYMSDNYMVGIDPTCLGSPASLSYQAAVYYAADPSNQNGDSITDVSPDGAMSPAIRRVTA